MIHLVIRNVNERIFKKTTKTYENIPDYHGRIYSFEISFSLDY